MLYKILGVPSHDQITLLLRSAASGDSRAASELLPLVYAELRALAESRMRKVPPGQTLQPTALVHEAYIRILAGHPADEFESSGHFFFVAARAMRDILVDQARRKATLKRGGDRRRVSPENLAIAIEAPAEDMLALNDALAALEQQHPRQHQLVMLRFFAGLTLGEAAEVLGTAERTAQRDWRFAKAYLRATLSESEQSDA